MFGTTSLTENPIYNFMSEENALKWKGQFLHALQEVSAKKTTHLKYIYIYILDWLEIKCVHSRPGII